MNIFGNLALSSQAIILKSPSAVQRPDFVDNAAIIKSEKKEAEQFPEKVLQKRDEILAFLLEVEKRHLQYTGSTKQQTVEAVINMLEKIPTMSHKMYPILSTSGKDNSSLVTYRNYRHWVSKLGRDNNGKLDISNKNALCDCYGQKKTERKGDPEFWHFFAQFFEDERQLSLNQAYSLARDNYIFKCQKENRPHNLPTKKQVRYYYDNYADQAALILRRKGKEFFENKVQGHITRTWDDVAVGQVWFGDHHVFDAPIKIWDELEQQWKPKRIWLTMWMDAKSLFFIGWLVRIGDPDSKGIEDALLHGIMQNNNCPPQILYCDNGKDYKSHGFIVPVEINKTEYSIAKALGCKNIFAIPYNAKAKTVERAFRNVTEAFAKRWEGYLGNKPVNRTERAKELWNTPEKLPTLQQFIEEWILYVNEYHQNAGQQSTITGGKCPQEMWNSRNQNLVRSLTNKELYMAFLKPYTRTPKVSRGASIRVDGNVYDADQLWPHLDKNVIVKCDRNNIEHLYVYDLNGVFICEAMKKQQAPAIALSDEDNELVKLQMKKYRGQHKRALTIAKDNQGGTIITAPINRLQLVDPNTKPQLPLDDMPMLPVAKKEEVVLNDVDPEMVKDFDAFRHHIFNNNPADDTDDPFTCSDFDKYSYTGDEDDDEKW